MTLDTRAIPPRWWETRVFALVLLAASIVPLLPVPLPPLTDLPGHIGRYHVARAVAGSADIARHWTYAWQPIGNLGVDLIVYALAPVMSVEAAARLAVMAIPPLWIGGLMLVSRVSGGRLSPAIAFALPLAYGYPFQFGFVNFMLACGLAFHALALWMWLGQRGRIALRALLFVPLAALLWIAHCSAWALLVASAFGAEAVRMRMQDRRWWPALLRAGVGCLPLALPLVAMLAPGARAPLEWNAVAKLAWLAMLLRERWMAWDIAGALVLLGMVAVALRRPRRIDPLAGGAAMGAFAAYLVQPRLALGGAYVDMRMLAPAVALVLAGFRPAAGERGIAVAAAVFAAARLAASTAALWLFAETQRHALEAVPHLPRGAGVLVLVGQPCEAGWSGRRLSHVAGIAVARRDIFANDQWMLAGQQSIGQRHAAAGRFGADPSQLVYPPDCPYQVTRFDDAIRSFDRGTFDHIWTIDLPARPRLARDVRRVWSNGVSALYAVDTPRIERRAPPR